jgi:excisionase family DNA binding protein
MKNEQYLSIQELANILGVSRISVYKRIKKGRISAIRIGRSFAIPKSHVSEISGKELNRLDKRQIDKAVKKTVKEYGEVLKLLGND